MDAISGVDGYKLSDTNRQGVIGKFIDNELTYIRDRKYQSTINFGVDENDIVSTFWQGVFKSLPKAKQFGQVVSVRVVDGQAFDGQITSIRNGVTYNDRPTQDNPIHWLRKEGRMAIRNSLNKLYRDNLTLICDDCGHESTVKTTETTTKCKCGSEDTKKIWPGGHSSYGAEKSRSCNVCNMVWKRKFSYLCHKCESSNTKIESKSEHREDHLEQIMSGDESAEDTMTRHEMSQELDDIIKLLFSSLPNDPQDNSAMTMKKELFNMMVDPKYGSNICKMCKLSSAKICSQRCLMSKAGVRCEHELILDPKECCGAESFTTELCVNYSKKLAEYHGCSPTLSHRHIKKLRTIIANKLKDLRHFDTCANMYDIIRNSETLSRYLNE